MKTKNIAYLLFSLVLLNYSLSGCSAPENKNQTTVSEPQTRQPDTPTNIEPKKKPEIATIVPGKSLADISLEEEIAAVRNKYGNPQGGDAAMGKAWAFWYFRDKPSAQTSDSCETDVFSVRDDPNFESMKVRQIRTTCQEYVTKEGISTGASEVTIRQQFPQAKPIARFQTKNPVTTLLIYDAIEQGIGFEIRVLPEAKTGKCTAILIHPAGKKLTQEYLSFYSDLKPM